MPVLIKGPISRTIYLVPYGLLGVFMGWCCWCLFGPIHPVLGCLGYIVYILLMVLVKIIFYIPMIFIADIAIDYTH